MRERRSSKSSQAFRTISEVADEVDLQQHVLRFWESKFTFLKPLKRGGNRRYYRPDDVRLIKALKVLLHEDGYTIRGVQNLFKTQGFKASVDAALGDGPSEIQPEIAPKQEEKIAVSSGPIELSAPPVKDEARISSAAKEVLQELLSDLKTLRASI